MPSKDPRQRLQDILDNIELVDRFSDGMDLASFSQDAKTIYATTRALEIISEATRRLPDALKARHPEIDWGAIAAAGNVYRHEYEVVDSAILWVTVREELPVLRGVVAEELAELGEG